MKALKRIPLWQQILAGVVLGAVIGFASPAAAEFISPWATSSCGCSKC